jgi:mannobiose 2-epimerase
LDRENGAWFRLVSKAGIPSNNKFKVDPWKYPYQNSRACLEVMARLDSMEHAHQKADGRHDSHREE